MKVLVGCEESQAVCIAFRNLGHEAYSCDLQECSGGHPEWHIQDDVLFYLNSGWDVMIAFPPCTHLAVSGARYFEQKQKDGRQQQGIDFFMQMVNAPIKHIAIENPVGIMSSIYRKPDQIIQPWMYGDDASKKTCLWLKGLPILLPIYCSWKKIYSNQTINGQNKVVHNGKWIGYNDPMTAKLRSKTFPGIAKAMAEQWGGMY
jgi:hypothetical protein